jgi:hypothetical protein
MRGSACIQAHAPLVELGKLVPDWLVTHKCLLEPPLNRGLRATRKQCNANPHCTLKEPPPRVRKTLTVRHRHHQSATSTPQVRDRARCTHAFSPQPAAGCDIAATQGGPRCEHDTCSECRIDTARFATRQCATTQLTTWQTTWLTT